MKHIFIVFLLFTILLSCQTSDEIIALSTEQQVERIVKPYTSFGFLSGVSVGVWEDNKASTFHFGMADPEAGIRPSDSTIYALGNLSQVLTCLLASDVIQEGKFRLNDSVDGLLPVIQSDFPERKIRVEDLGTHTSGLISEPINEYDRLPQAEQALAYRDFNEEDLYQFISSESLFSAPGVRYAYSRAGIATLAQITEIESGESLDELFQERFARSIGMRNTQTLSAFTETQYSLLPPAFSPDQEKLTHFRHGVMDGSSGFYSTIGDMVKFLAVQMNPFSSISDAIELTHEPRFDLGAEISVSFGWLIDGTTSNTVIFQSGASSHSAFIGFVPDKGAGVVILTNTNAESSVRDIGREILRWLGQ